MDKDNDILAKINGKSGMTVPDGYFAEFAKNMAMNLPERESQNIAPAHRSTWQQVRPYVYLAAMFMGIWCMLKMFTLMSSDGRQPLETNPIMAEAFGNDTFVNEYVIDDISQWDIYDEMMEDGIDAAAFCDSLEQLSQVQVQ